MEELDLQPSRSPGDYYFSFFEGWRGAGMLVGAYAAAELASYTLGRLPGLFLFLAWNVIFGPMIALLVIVMTLRASVLATSSVWRRLIIVSSIAVPVAIILITLTGGRGVARFFGLG